MCLYTYLSNDCTYLHIFAFIFIYFLIIAFIQNLWENKRIQQKYKIYIISCEMMSFDYVIAGEYPILCMWVISFIWDCMYIAKTWPGYDRRKLLNYKGSANVFFFEDRVNLRHMVQRPLLAHFWWKMTQLYL